MKYDDYRARKTRYPTASGVRGNPWSDVSSQYPPPPRRPPMQTRPSATASRYAAWTTPSQKTPRDDPSERARAWDRMRPSPTSKQSQPSSAEAPSPQTVPRSKPKPADPPPTPTPRTEARRKKTEASFGTRRTGFTQQMDDEPPAPNSNYFSTKQHSNMFYEAANAARTETRKPRPVPAPEQADDPSSPLTQKFRETFLDTRQSTPYSSHGGERTNPFDGTTINRGKSVRDNPRPSSNVNRNSNPDLAPRQRSASLPDESENIKQATRDKDRFTGDDGGRKFQSSRAGERYTPRDNTTPASAPSNTPGQSTPTVNNAEGELGPRGPI
jgi:hypothetical protein